MSSIILSAGGVSFADLAPLLDEDSARVVLLEARRVAPCLPDFAPGTEEYANALAVLRAVAKRYKDMGTGVYESMSRNGTSAKYRSVESAFSTQHIDALRLLCGDCTTPQPALPRAAFPAPRPIWPEGEYS